MVGTQDLRHDNPTDHDNDDDDANLNKVGPWFRLNQQFVHCVCVCDFVRYKHQLRTLT